MKPITFTDQCNSSWWTLCRMFKNTTAREQGYNTVLKTKKFPRNSLECSLFLPSFPISSFSGKLAWLISVHSDSNFILFPLNSQFVFHQEVLNHFTRKCLWARWRVQLGNFCLQEGETHQNITYLRSMNKSTRGREGHEAIGRRQHCRDLRVCPGFL